MFVHFLGSRFGSMTEQTPGSFFNEALFIFHRYLRSLWCNKLWNSLPLPVRECPTFNTFKTHLKQWLLENQSCTHF